MYRKKNPNQYISSLFSIGYSRNVPLFSFLIWSLCFYVFGQNPISSTQIYSPFVNEYLESYNIDDRFMMVAAKREDTPDKVTINNRKNLFQKLHPKTKVPEKDIIDILKVEKYIKDRSVLTCSESELYKAYLHKIEGDKDIRSISFEAYRPVLESKVFLTYPENRKLIMYSVLNRDLGNTSDVTWYPEKLLLPCNENICLAQNPETGECLINVYDFNKGIYGYSSRKENSKVKARESILDRMLQDVYFSYQAKEKKLLQNQMHKMEFSLSKSSLESDRIIQELFSYNDRNNLFSKEQLLSRYSDMYETHFSAYDSVVVKVLGSTDSLFIDSLYQSILKSARDIDNKPTRVPSGKKQRKYVSYDRTTKDLLWNTLSWEELPHELFFCIDTLYEKELSDIIHTTYGHFILYIDETIPVPEITFEEVRSELVLAEFKNRDIESQHVNEKYLNDYYRDNLSDYIFDGDYKLKLWLYPASNNNDFSIDDTISFQSKMLKSNHVPDILWNSIRDTIFSCVVKTLNGPIFSPIGNVYFFITNVEEKGGTPLPFHIIKEEVELNFLKSQKKSVTQLFFNNDIVSKQLLSKMYQREVNQELFSLSEAAFLSMQDTLRALNLLPDASEISNSQNSLSEQRIPFAKGYRFVRKERAKAWIKEQDVFYERLVDCW